MPRASTEWSSSSYEGLFIVNTSLHHYANSMHLAYIDEIGETGAFISHDHPKFNTTPAFGYAGFIIPAETSRAFGQIFARERNQRFAAKLAETKAPGRWEVKGADMFRPSTPRDRPENIRIFGGLIQALSAHGGQLFYYADEKPIGTPKQTALDPSHREQEAMRETLNRIATYADSQDDQVMVLIDSINEKTRAQRVADMYAHIFSRASEHPEMRQIVEPPMHLDSVLSSNIQFADWVAAFLNRAIDRQLLINSPYDWVPRVGDQINIRGKFTHESKLHLHDYRGMTDIHHSQILRNERPALGPNPHNSLRNRMTEENLARLRKIVSGSTPRLK